MATASCRDRSRDSTFFASEGICEHYALSGKYESTTMSCIFPVLSGVWPCLGAIAEIGFHINLPVVGGRPSASDGPHDDTPPAAAGNPPRRSPPGGFPGGSAGFDRPSRAQG